jgi:hypothetical protein
LKLPNIIFIFGPLLWCVFTSYFLYTGFVTEKVINVKEYDLTSYARLDESPWAYWISMAMIGFSTFGSVLVSYVFFSAWRTNSKSE